MTTGWTVIGVGGRATLLLLLLWLTFGCGQAPAPVPGPESAETSPLPDFADHNIIIFNIDTLRADHLGCYGYHRDTSPNIDAFATESALFEWAYSQGPNTPPSQASILTGLYPTTHGRFEGEDVVADDIVTLAEALTDRGYATAAFVDGGMMVRGFGLEQGFDVYDDEGGNLEAIGPKVYGWLLDHLRTGGSRPFLLMVHTYDAHSPYEVTPEPFRSWFVPGLERPDDAFVDGMTWEVEQFWRARFEDDPPLLDDVQLEWTRAMYDGGIRHTDDWFGTFLDLLRHRNLLDDTIVAVISDHGDEFQEHGSIYHDKIYSTVTRVPFLIRFPEGWSAGRYGFVIETIDMMPTLLEAVGATVPPGTQGRSLLGNLQGEPREPQIAFSESRYYGRRIAAADSTYRTFLTQQGGGIELYRYREDPMEQEDLAATEAERAAAGREAIERWLQKVTAESVESGEKGSFDDEALEQLEALGYIESDG